MVELEQLKEQIDAAGEKIKSLKTAEGVVDKAAIGAAVTNLLELKKQYAELNNGIGVDGKPFEAPMSKAEKKAKDKADKAGGAGGPAKQVRLLCIWMYDLSELMEKSTAMMVVFL
jgi:hypothetical protein